MAIEIRFPRLGWSMEEGIFVRWLKQSGEPVRAGEPLLEVEGDKAAQEVEATDDGLLFVPADAPPPGSLLPVGRLLGYLLAQGEAPPAGGPVSILAAGGGGNLSSAAPAEAQASSPAAAIARDNAAAAGFVGAEHRQAISPRAKKLAARLGIDWRAASGSGRGGRIRQADIRAAFEKGGAMSPATGRAAAAQASWGTVPGRLVPVLAARRTIARRMSAGVHQAAPVTLFRHVDMENPAALRDELRGTATSGEPAPTYGDLLLKLSAAMLPRHVSLVAQWREEALFIPDQIDVAFAVDCEQGLVAPVIRDPANLSLARVAAASRELIERARSGRLSAEHLEGGAFTVTNLGSYGVDAFTPILNWPQTAILGVGTIRRRPAVVGDAVVPRLMATLCLTFDHRAVDGAPAARFLDELAETLADRTRLDQCLGHVRSNP